MAWTLEQQIRLVLEREGLKSELSHFQIFNPRGDLYVEGWQPTTVSGERYRLTLQVPQNYPTEKPHLYVTHPHDLWMYGYQGTINQLNTSSIYHTWENREDGCVQICYGHWDAGKTFFWVLFQGIIWVEAHAQHLKSGETIDAIITKWRKDYLR